VIGLFAFAWIAGIAEIAGKPEDEFATGTRTTWLLLVIFTGILGLVAYVLVGKKRGTALKGVNPSGDHIVRWDGSLARWACSQCSFKSVDEEAARAHRLKMKPGLPEQRPSAPQSAITTATMPAAASPAPTATPEFKTCPDCAEEVRFAARKCRFCGYMFESADVPR
jgi:hypothetical protein